MNPRAIIVFVVLIPVYRDPPSSSVFPAARIVDTTGEGLEEKPSQERSNVVPLRPVAA